MHSASNPFLYLSQEGLQKVKVLYVTIAMQSARIGNVVSNVCRKTMKKMLKFECDGKMKKEGAPDFNQ